MKNTLTNQTPWKPGKAHSYLSFMKSVCFKCQQHERCGILNDACVYSVDSVDYPAELVIDNNKPTCTAFVKF